LRIAVVGLGLIGASLGLAARERLGATVCGWDPDPEAIEAALGLGAIDSGAGPLAGAVAAADAVFLAAPVAALPQLAGAVLDLVAPGSVVTDVGSTKRSLCEAVSDPRFVGGHPLAGAESRGSAAARGDMFSGATWYLTPGPASAPRALAAVRELVQRFGARPVEIDAAVHDRLMATVSHLPHVFANVLASQLGAIGGEPAVGPSFRDGTRVAGANSELWCDIFLDNRAALDAAIAEAIGELSTVRALLARGDRDGLRALSERAGAARARLGP
jgi:prephenate dehydrogenase